MSGQRSQRSRVTQEGRRKEAASAATYLTSGHRIPAALVGFRKSSLHSTCCVSLSPASPSLCCRRSFSQLQKTAERKEGPPERRRHAGALGLEDDVAAGSSNGRRCRAASLSLRPHWSHAPARPLRLRPRARPPVLCPLVYLSPWASSIAVDVTAHESLRACARACRSAVPVRRQCKCVCTEGQSAAAAAVSTGMHGIHQRI